MIGGITALIPECLPLPALWDSSRLTLWCGICVLALGVTMLKCFSPCPFLSLLPVFFENLLPVPWCDAPRSLLGVMSHSGQLIRPSSQWPGRYPERAEYDAIHRRNFGSDVNLIMEVVFSPTWLYFVWIKLLWAYLVVIRGERRVTPSISFTGLLHMLLTASCPLLQTETWPNAAPLNAESDVFCVKHKGGMVFLLMISTSSAKQLIYKKA